MSKTPAPCAFADLLVKAVNEPGTLSRAYTQFHNYSLGNVLLAWSQCAAREIPLGPMATFNRWRELGRYVRKGQKALTLCQPITIKRKGDDATKATEATEDEYFVRFMFRPRWFVLAQTDGAELPPADPPGWDKVRALTALDVAEVPFEMLSGNVMGYARARQISVSPLNPHPCKTLFHECAHVLLGHTAHGRQSDADTIPHSLEEAEAECVALLCCEVLGLPGAPEARGYIQHWIGRGTPIPERSAQRILRVADQILKAGATAAAVEEGE